MPNVRNALRSALLVALVLAVPASAAVAAEDPPPSTNVIEFVTHARGSGGVVRCGLFEKSGWLKKPVKPAVAKIFGGRALCVFRGIPAGTYGMSAFHDENSNGKLDTNFIGMPIEDYCASRNARGTFGPPSFEDAKFEYAGGTKRLEARLK